MIERYKGLSLPMKATIWITISTFFIKGLGFITSPVFTRIMPEAEYGMYSVFQSYINLLLIITTWELQIGAYQRGIFLYKSEKEKFTTAIQLLINIITSLAFLLILVFHKRFNELTGFTIELQILMFFYYLTWPSYFLWMADKKKTYKYRAITSASIIYTMLTLLAEILSVLLISNTAVIRISALLITSCLFSIPFWIKNARFSQIFENWNKVKEYWKFCLLFGIPLIFNSLSFLVLAQADRVMITKMVGPEQTAFYSLACSIAGVVDVFQKSINQTLLPWRYQKLDDKNYKSIRKVTMSLLIFYGGLVLVFLLVIPEGMKLIYPDSYYEAVYSIAPVVAGGFFMFMYSMFVNVESYYKKTKYILYVSLVCSVTNIALNYFGIKLFGYIACGYTTLTCYVLLAVGHYIFMKKTLLEAGIKEPVVNTGLALVLGVVIIIGSIAISLLFSFPMIRYGIFGLAIMLFLTNKQRILGMFKLIRGK